ncbi:hypothetical protein DMA15_29445 [Streptomyces sp. WAC 01529]|uniref:hypothetical protein n=1 Tax=Streptomyces sp. WAC 01529 TaxID=2203205 RepID=UPI000F6F3CAD|nr:hypothetical protein [Streptomyces sp. WAC 01529]AZM56210.1 hypothetical protein DMA15_29445 [Streptomyces sp. WAC 01529]
MNRPYAGSDRLLPRRPAVLASAVTVCLALSVCAVYLTLSACAAKPPAEPVREPEHRLLEQFRSWARETDESRTARHAHALATVELTGTDKAYDYDVEVRTDLTAGSATAEDLSALLRTWWDGDDGEGTARDLVLLDARGDRLAHSRL